MCTRKMKIRKEKQRGGKRNSMGRKESNHKERDNEIKTVLEKKIARIGAKKNTNMTVSGRGKKNQKKRGRQNNAGERPLNTVAYKRRQGKKSEKD